MKTHLAYEYPYGDSLLTGGTLVVGVAMVVTVVAELLVEVFRAAEEFASMEMPASMIVELLGPAPNVKRDPAERKINCCLHMIWS